jgi:O-antigen ligase
MVTLMFGLLVIPLTLSLSPGRLAAAIVLLGVSGGLAVTYAPEQVVERLGTTTDQEGASLGGRLKLWGAGFNAFTRKPLIGYGVSGFKRAVTPELGILALVAHNSFLSVLVEEGLIGLVLYSLMLLTVFLSLLRIPGRLERRFGLVLMLTLGVAMSPLTWEDNKVTWLILSFLAGMSAIHITARRRGDQRRPVPLGRPLAQTVG